MRWTPDSPPLSLSSRKLANQTTPLTWKSWGPGPDYYGLADAERPPNDRRTTDGRAASSPTGSREPADVARVAAGGAQRTSRLIAQ